MRTSTPTTYPTANEIVARRIRAGASSIRGRRRSSLRITPRTLRPRTRALRGTLRPAQAIQSRSNEIHPFSVILYYLYHVANDTSTFWAFLGGIYSHAGVPVVVVVVAAADVGVWLLFRRRRCVRVRVFVACVCVCACVPIRRTFVLSAGASVRCVRCVACVACVRAAHTSRADTSRDDICKRRRCERTSEQLGFAQVSSTFRPPRLVAQAYAANERKQNICAMKLTFFNISVG